MKQSNNNNQEDEIRWSRCDPCLTMRGGSESPNHEPTGGGSSVQTKEIRSSSSSLMPPSSLHDQQHEQQYEINRRSRSNSIAAGAIARLKNLPQIKLSLPPEDLLPPANPSSCSPSPTAGMNLSFPSHESSSSPESLSPGISSNIFDQQLLTPVPNPASSSFLHHRRLDPQQSGRKKKKVLDQKDLNLKPDSDQSMRRSSLPINDQLLGTSSIQIRFLSQTAGRRLSQVSSVVSAQIQSTIGWRSLISEEEVVDQAKCLAAKFVWIKLRKSGFCHKRFHLQRLRSVCNFADNEDVDRTLNQVASELRALSHELESAHPKIFNSVLNQVGPSCFKSVSSVTKTQILVGQFLFSCQEITWTHVAAFFTITAALALDSVISGHHDFVMPLIDSFAEFANGDLAHWVAQEGGWVRQNFDPSLNRVPGNENEKPLEIIVCRWIKNTPSIFDFPILVRMFSSDLSS